MSDFVLDASVALQWLFEDEIDRGYSLEILSSLSEKRAVVPMLWFYEVGEWNRSGGTPKAICAATPRWFFDPPKGITN